MATSYYFLDADWRSNTDTPYIPYGDKAFKNVYDQDWLSNHSYLFYNGGSASNNNTNSYKNIKSPYLYSYSSSYEKPYIPSLYSNFKIKSKISDMLGGYNNNDKNNINELKDKNLYSGEPLLYKSKEILGPNPCFQPYRYSNNAVIDSTFLPGIDKNLPPINYYPYGGGRNNHIFKNIKKKHAKQSKKNKNTKINTVYKFTKKKALNKRTTRKQKQK